MLLLVYHACPAAVNHHLTYYKFHIKTDHSFLGFWSLNQNTAGAIHI